MGYLEAPDQEDRKIEGEVSRRKPMGRVAGVTFRRNRSMMLGEVSVRVLQIQPGLTSRQIAERIVPVVHQYRFNNATLGWILKRTPGVIVVKSSPSKVATYELEPGREAYLPQNTEKRLLNQMEKFHSP